MQFETLVDNITDAERTLLILVDVVFERFMVPDDNERELETLVELNEDVNVLIIEILDEVMLEILFESDVLLLLVDEIWLDILVDNDDVTDTLFDVVKLPIVERDTRVLSKDETDVENKVDNELTV